MHVLPRCMYLFQTLAEMGAIERQFTLLEKYNPTVELVADYIELFIQFG